MLQTSLRGSGSSARQSKNHHEWSPYYHYHYPKHARPHRNARAHNCNEGQCISKTLFESFIAPNPWPNEVHHSVTFFVQKVVPVGDCIFLAEFVQQPPSACFGCDAQNTVHSCTFLEKLHLSSSCPVTPLATARSATGHASSGMARTLALLRS